MESGYHGLLMLFRFGIGSLVHHGPVYRGLWGEMIIGPCDNGSPYDRAVDRKHYPQSHPKPVDDAQLDPCHLSLRGVGLPAH